MKSPVRKQTDEDREFEIFKRFIAPKKVLLADPSPTTRSGAFKLLTEIGAKPFQIILASNFLDAKAAVLEHKPDIVLTEYDMGKHCGLELLQSQRANNPDFNHTIFILLTSNTSQSAVAQAVEEDVDAYLVKPFTRNTLRKTILAIAHSKMSPPPYMMSIEAGKEELKRGLVERAETHFEEALKLDPKPSLACYYLGQSRMQRKVADEAKKFFQRGLEYNRIHYKCLVGLYDVYQLEKNHDSAYDVAKRLSQYFPANPKRLAEVVRLSVVTKMYEDIERYYAIYTNLDERDESLTTHICAGLVVCGKHYLITKNKARALEVFLKAAIACAGRVKILREIVQSLVDHRLFDDADRFLKRFHPDQHRSEDYLMLDLQIANGVSPASTVVQKGRAMLASGFGSPLLFQILIERSLELKLFYAADDLCHSACTKHPDLRSRFESMLRSARDEAERVTQG